MGCDIHGTYERKGHYGWVNSGDPDIGRDYNIYGIIANVRNRGVPFIAEHRINLFDENELWHFSDAYRALCEEWSGDGHSHSYVTLKELKEYDTTQTYKSTQLITGKDESGNITSVCSWTNGKHFGEVGEISVFGVFGDDRWKKLISYGENIRNFHNLTDEQVRFVFFFDN